MIRSIVDENNRGRPKPVKVCRTSRRCRRNVVPVVIVVVNSVGNVRTIRVVYHIRCGWVVVSMGKLRTKYKLPEIVGMIRFACIRSDRGFMIVCVKIATAVATTTITPTIPTGDFNLTIDDGRGTNFLPIITGRHDKDNTIICVCVCACVRVCVCV